MADQLEWKPIQTAPQGKTIIGRFWHGWRYWIVEAQARGDGGWQDIENGSCVGWTLASRRPGYWLCEAPATTKGEQTNAE